MKLWAHTDTCFPAGRRSQGSGNCKQKYTASPRDVGALALRKCSDVSGVLTQLLPGRLWLDCPLFYPAIMYRVAEERRMVNESCAVGVGSFSLDTRPLNVTATASSEDVFVRKKIMSERAAVLVLYLVYQTESALAERM